MLCKPMVQHHTPGKIAGFSGIRVLALRLMGPLLGILEPHVEETILDMRKEIENGLDHIAIQNVSRLMKDAILEIRFQINRFVVHDSVSLMGVRL